MLSNQVLNKIIADIHKIIGVDCSVWNMNGKCLVATCEEYAWVQKTVQEIAVSEEEEKITSQAAFFLIRDNEEPDYILAIHGVIDNVEQLGRLCVCQFEHLIQAYKAKVDKNRFFQNLLLDNLLLVDVYNQAKKLGVEVEEQRAVFVIEPKSEEDNLVLETMKGLYATGTKDFVTSVDEKHIILIKAVEHTDGYK